MIKTNFSRKQGCVTGYHIQKFSSENLKLLWSYKAQQSRQSRGQV